MKNQPTGSEQPKFVPEPAESFAIEFLNTKPEEIRNAMREIGGFIFSGGGPEKDENHVYFTGERNDGTKIKITIEKGEDYKSPAKIAEIERVKKEKEKK